MKIGNHIFNLLKEHDCVIIPDFGAFILRNVSAKISKDQTKIYPPNKEISLNVNLKKNDGLLINTIASIENISFIKAEKKVSSWVERNLKKLKNNSFIEIKNIGSITLKDEKYIFEPNQNSIFLKSSFGLSIIDSSKIIKQKANSNKSYLKYAAILVVAFSLIGIFTNNYFNDIKEYNLDSYAKANIEIEKKIQKATFKINKALPIVKLPIKKQYGNFHIIAGSFRQEENSLKLINQLKSKGYAEARKVGINKFGLFQIAYNSYDTVDQARIALSEIRKIEDVNAWLLIKK